eukprot:4416329-Amphidinium_carterae.1
MEHAQPVTLSRKACVFGATAALVMDSASDAGHSAAASGQRAAKKARKFENAARLTMNSMMDQALADIN